MSVDYIRIYQPQNAINYGCDPDNFPTADYIDTCVLLCCYIHGLVVTGNWVISTFLIGIRSRIQTRISRHGNSMVSYGRRTICPLLDVHSFFFF